MQEAIEQAKKCIVDVPVGCVIRYNGRTIAATHNQREKMVDVTAHAEILAIQEAQKKLGTSRLKNCDMYVTLEPCPMCAWAIIQSGIRCIYFGSYNNQYGALGSVLDLPKIANSKIKIYGGMEELSCDKILSDFFKTIRNY